MEGGSEEALEVIEVESGGGGWCPEFTTPEITKVSKVSTPPPHPLEKTRRGKSRDTQGMGPASDGRVGAVGMCCGLDRCVVVGTFVVVVVVVVVVEMMDDDDWDWDWDLGVGEFLWGLMIYRYLPLCKKMYKYKNIKIQRDDLPSASPLTKKKPWNIISQVIYFTSHQENK